MNPEAVTQIYSVPPSLARVQLTEIALHRDGPRISVHAILSGFPDNPPRRWLRDGCNAAAIQLDLFAVSDVALAGWSTDTTTDLEITEAPGGRVAFSARFPGGSLSALCESFRIAHFSAHIAGS
jgi:hypothetical protein